MHIWVRKIDHNWLKMACCFGAKSFSEPTQAYFQLDPQQEQFQRNFNQRNINFHCTLGKMVFEMLCTEWWPFRRPFCAQHFEKHFLKCKMKNNEFRLKFRWNCSCWGSNALNWRYLIHVSSGLFHRRQFMQWLAANIATLVSTIRILSEIGIAVDLLFSTH